MLLGALSRQSGWRQQDRPFASAAENAAHCRRSSFADAARRHSPNRPLETERSISSCGASAMQDGAAVRRCGDRILTASDRGTILAIKPSDDGAAWQAPRWSKRSLVKRVRPSCLQARKPHCGRLGSSTSRKPRHALQPQSQRSFFNKALN